MSRLRIRFRESGKKRFTVGKNVSESEKNVSESEKNVSETVFEKFPQSPSTGKITLCHLPPDKRSVILIMLLSSWGPDALPKQE